VRSPSDLPTPSRLGRVSRRFWIAVGIFVLLLGFLSLRTLATLWTDQMWFSQAGFGNVFTKLFFTKVLLVVIFGALFAIGLFVNLWLADRSGPRNLTNSPEDEMIRRFQNLVHPYAKRIYGVIALVSGFIAGLNAIGQWQNFLLFMHGQSFHQRDPLFHKDLSFYVFTLPFVRFVITWGVVVLILQLILTTIASYMHGGIRAGAGYLPRLSPAVRSHLSVLGALIALLKAAGYVVERWSLVNSGSGYVNGAGYTDIHARMPALSILIVLSIVAAGLLLANVRLQQWRLPAVAVGLWVFVSLIIGVAYPALLQTLKVSPNQNSLEAPYIARNISATRSAFNLSNVTYTNFTGTKNVTTGEVKTDQATLANVRLWDPDPNIALVSVNKRQSIRSYYQFASLGVDRYNVNGVVTPVLIGARQINANSLPASGWVNTHLQYTHGYGAAVLLANQADPTTGNPVFGVSDVPSVSANGLPVITQPGIYFGLNQSGWVVANTKQSELDYQISSGALADQPVETHYAGNGGVKVGNFFSRAALALRLSDFNFLISNDITSNSRVLFVRDVQAMAAKAAPFLSFDSNPYAVIDNGHIDFVLDGYTTTDQYPYSQNAGNLNINPGGLPGSFNYVRNSVKVVVNAYSGQMTFYANDPTDPILKTYAAIFPGMFHPMSSMPATIAAHLHYPGDLFGVQAAILGRYHITTPSAFFNASDQWEVSPTTGAGSPSQTIQQSVSTDAAGNIVSVANTPMSPVLQVGALPNQTNQQLLETVEFVPAGNSNTVQSLAAFMVATSNPNNYGKLTVYVTTRGQSVTGPVQADAEIQQNATVSETTSLLDQHGSSVLLGNNIMIPLDNSVLYVRPMYTTSTANSLPQLRYVIAVFNQQVGIAPTLSGALSQVLGATIATTPTAGGAATGSGTATTTTTSPVTGQSVSAYLSQAAADYQAAQAALAAGNLGKYQSDVNAMNQEIAAAQKVLASQKG
jgi:uncharacterized protein